MAKGRRRGIRIDPQFNRGPWSASQDECRGETLKGWRDVPCTPSTRVEFRGPANLPPAVIPDPAQPAPFVVEKAYAGPWELWIDGSLVGVLWPQDTETGRWIRDALMSYGGGKHHEAGG